MGKTRGSIDKAAPITDEMADKYKALEKDHLELQAAYQRSRAFGEMMQSQLRQSNLGTKALETRLKEWEVIGKGSSTLTDKLERQASEISQLKKRLESSESRVRQLEIEHLELTKNSDGLQERFEYAKECVQLFKADSESSKKELYQVREDLEKQKTLLNEEKHCNKVALQLLDEELVRKQAELNKVRKIQERCSPTTHPTTLEQCAETLGLEWGVSA